MIHVESYETLLEEAGVRNVGWWMTGHVHKHSSFKTESVTVWSLYRIINVNL